MRIRPAKRAVVIAVAIICAVFLWATCNIVSTVNEWTADLAPIENTDFLHYAQKSTMYADDGTTVLAKFQLEKRDPIDFDQISPYVIYATIDTEDVRFYGHHGVDVAGIVRALFNNICGGPLEGASTITQQLVRNTVLTQEASDISLKRKVREAKLAIDLENHYSKDEILLMYLNTINYGDGCYGIQAAAQNYFQINARELNLTQAATLAGIPQSPTLFNPKENPDACLERRNTVLRRIYEQGNITKEEYEAAKLEGLELNPAPEAPLDGIYAYHFFTSYVRDLLLAQDNPYDCSYADLFRGGLSIYTSINPALQDSAEVACAAQCQRMDEALDAALVAIDVETGQIKAMVGGKDYATSQVNIATGTGGSGRQAGSTFKIFTLAAAIEQGISPQTLLDCTSPLTKVFNGQQIQFENFDGADYGIRDIQSATAISSNTGYLRLSEAIGQDLTCEMATRLGVTSPLSNVYTITLGAADVTPLDLASACTTLAAGGVKQDSVVVTKILDDKGDVIYTAPDTKHRVLDASVAGATTQVLRGVFEGGTASSARLKNGQPTAGKTGTSSDFADHWLVGYTPSLCTAVWIGNPAGAISTNPSLTCNMLWKDFMDRATENSEIQYFPQLQAPPYNNPLNAKQNKELEEKQKALEEKEKEEREKEEREEEERKKKESHDITTAPDTTGKTFSEAVELLDGYNAGYLEQYSDTVAAGIIISQSVQNNQVVIVVSLGPKP